MLRRPETSVSGHSTPMRRSKCKRTEQEVPYLEDAVEATARRTKCCRVASVMRTIKTCSGRRGSGMAPYLKTLLVAAVLVLVLPFVPPAFAHHVMGGGLPSTAWQGLLSGLGHPIIGIDHLAFIVAIGLMSDLVARIVLLPLLFVLGTVLGCFIHVQGYDLASSERGYDHNRCCPSA